MATSDSGGEASDDNPLRVLTAPIKSVAARREKNNKKQKNKKTKKQKNKKTKKKQTDRERAKPTRFGTVQKTRDRDECHRSTARWRRAPAVSASSARSGSGACSEWPGWMTYEAQNKPYVHSKAEVKEIFEMCDKNKLYSIRKKIR
jgi:hypothetical protein